MVGSSSSSPTLTAMITHPIQEKLSK
jgi:hypothetical protein